MPDSRIPVDVFNPGQVFACLGLLEAASILFEDAQGGFDWSEAARVQFLLRASGSEGPVSDILNFLTEAEVATLAPVGSANSTTKWKVPTRTFDEVDVFPFPDPASPATLPARLTDRSGRQIIIDHWGDATRRDNVKFWAGAGGYPGAALVRDALDLVRELPEHAASDPFSVSANQSSSLRLDWRRDYVPLDAGFSPNEHPEMVMQGYPLVEVLAAIGLTHARPKRIGKLEYRYSVIGITGEEDLLTPVLLRAALGCSALPFITRVFCMRLNWPGQENQARCITSVTEESGQC
ncbi:type I-U CRISPR-associated protein Cas8c [Steroidobacter sp. S1-65]|uniref:Type I-U CRISPR-associated protein Cas8c n=1 Tax=Steroidobacter gossypii TaxID=2805490 RepID=A0ABS1WXW2_9GAMM|nr:type I-U CRISPR-associated protein Cas8c [Steroidobacter gossypii]MBM0105817.1 type I-U CRISPR-associated protein Cas8c [Steroidobacter gossypii]